MFFHSEEKYQKKIPNCTFQVKHKSSLCKSFNLHSTDLYWVVKKYFALCESILYHSRVKSENIKCICVSKSSAASNRHWKQNYFQHLAWVQNIPRNKACRIDAKDFSSVCPNQHCYFRINDINSLYTRNKLSGWDFGRIQEIESGWVEKIGLVFSSSIVLCLLISLFHLSSL